MAFFVELAGKLNSIQLFPRDQTDRKTFLWESKIIRLRMPTRSSFRSRSCSQTDKWKSIFILKLVFYQVTKPSLLSSSVHLVLVYNECDITALKLKEAVVCNLTTRFLDFQHSVSSVSIADIKVGNAVPIMTNNKKKTFFVVLSRVENCGDFVGDLLSWSQNNLIYGVHFNRMVAEEDVLNFDCNKFPVDVTGFIFGKDNERLYSNCFPVLLYILHLVLGENGVRVKHPDNTTMVNDEDSGCSSDNKSIHTNNLKAGENVLTGQLNNIRVDSTYKWTLAFVYKEVTSVLDGLCKECHFIILPRRSIDEDIQKPSESDNIPTGSAVIDDLPGVFDSNLKDVPLMANVNEVLVYHYILHLDVCFEERCISGTEILFLKPASEEIVESEFQMCLDCTLIDILSVEEVILPEGDFNVHLHQGDNQCCCCCTPKQKSPGKPWCVSCRLLQKQEAAYRTKDLNFRTLPYAVYGWCIRVWNVEGCKKYWPRCVAIKYKTKPSGPSLAWSKDQDGKYEDSV